VLNYLIDDDLALWNGEESLAHSHELERPNDSSEIPRRGKLAANGRHDVLLRRDIRAR